MSDIMFLLWENHAEWSNETFGTERGPVGPLRHLALEAKEAEDAPHDPIEFADCLLLIFDAARRAGHDYSTLRNAAFTKLEILKKRKYEQVAAEFVQAFDGVTP